MSETKELIETSGEAQTPLADLVRKALERMARGPRMLLDSFPDDPSLMSSSFGPEVTKEIASLLASQAEEIERLKALAICGPLGHPQGCSVCERCKAETQLAYADAKAARLTRERDKVLEALKELEDANEALCATHSTSTYHRMIDADHAGDALEELDAARRRARSVLQSSSDRKSPDE
jgi:hypothetical protein